MQYHSLDSLTSDKHQSSNVASTDSDRGLFGMAFTLNKVKWRFFNMATSTYNDTQGEKAEQCLVTLMNIPGHHRCLLLKNILLLSCYGFPQVDMYTKMFGNSTPSPVIIID